MLIAAIAGKGGVSYEYCSQFSAKMKTLQNSGMRSRNLVKGAIANWLASCFSEDVQLRVECDRFGHMCCDRRVIVF